MSKNQPSPKEKPKTVVIPPSQELNVDVDLRRLHEACSALGDYILPFSKRIRLELQRVRDGEQPDVPTVPLFLYNEIPYNEIKLLFSGILSSYPFLREIQLHHCAVGDDGILIIVEFIRSYRPTPDRNPFGIQRLEVPGCLIGPTGAKHIGKLLSENDTITRCVLDFNPLGDAGAQAIANGVRWNGSLEDLSLQYCQIFSLGANALAEGVLRCSNVRIFSLRGNPLGPEGIKYIGLALGIGNRIESIDIADTRFAVSSQAVEALCQGAESSSSLTCVDMDLNVVTPEAAPLIAAVIQKNNRLVQFRVNERMDSNQFLMIQNALEQNGRSTKKKKRTKS
ncbi:Leucine-rich repeat [Trypanosoma melophagium]|uniref:Leucine-rich repeat n=1 Tax=Trypanosoma melophagium TaxID=715481 RepID=UPI00351A2E41|nr:Leucine-rich repeat [Trypanosoma melophagium]